MDPIVSRTYQRSKDKEGMIHVLLVSDRTTVEFSGTSNQLISFSLVSTFMICLCLYSGYLDDFFAKTCDFWQNQSFYFQYIFSYNTYMSFKSLVILFYFTYFILMYMGRLCKGAKQRKNIPEYLDTFLRQWWKRLFLFSTHIICFYLLFICVHIIYSKKYVFHKIVHYDIHYFIYLIVSLNMLTVSLFSMWKM